MYLVMKHFTSDDIPVLLTSSKEKAGRMVDDLCKQIDEGEVFATKEEQDLIGADIGSEVVCASVVEFEKGQPVTMSKGEVK